MSSASQNVVVVGSAGHAKVVIDILEQDARYHLVGLIDSFRPAGDTVFDHSILGTEIELPALSKSLELHGCVIAIGDNWRRHLVAEKIAQLVPTLAFISAVHPSAQVARRVSVGHGTVIMAGAVVNSGSRIGNFCILNTRASLDHDGAMDDFSSLAPGATLGGDVSLGAFSAVGLGANVIHGRNIGKHAVVGAGALVLEDVPDASVVYGVPAQVVRARQPGDEYL